MHDYSTLYTWTHILTSLKIWIILDSYVLEDDSLFNGRCVGECVPLSITSTVTFFVEFMGGSSECEMIYRHTLPRVTSNQE